MVVAEKQDESLQDVSQAITAITDFDLETRNINSFVDLSALAQPNKKTKASAVVSIRGVGVDKPKCSCPISRLPYGRHICCLTFSSKQTLSTLKNRSSARPSRTLFGQNSLEAQLILSARHFFELSKVRRTLP